MLPGTVSLEGAVSGCGVPGVAPPRALSEDTLSQVGLVPSGAGGGTPHIPYPHPGVPDFSFLPSSVDTSSFSFSKNNSADFF